MTAGLDPRSRFLVTTVVVIALATTEAASPTFWRVGTQAEFLRGHVENISIDADGQLLLGPQTDTIYETTEPFLWTLVTADDALLLGSGTDGRVVRVEPDGTATTVFESEELDVHAVAPGPAGAIYVGTSPNGQVMRIGPDSTSTPFLDPDEPYIWAIAVATDGGVFVATGDPGRIYRVDASGAVELFYDPEVTHVLSLAFDSVGNLIAGTGGPGQVFRIDPTGRAFVLLDSNYDEITSLRVADDGTIYAVAASGSANPGSPATAPTPSVSSTTQSVSVTTQVTAVVTTSNTSGTVQPGPSTTRATGTTGAVYRITPDGTWDLAWDSDQDSPYDVALDDQGGLIIGTGNAGKIFRVTQNPDTTVLFTRAPVQQVTSLATGPDGLLYYATANPGKLYRLTATHTAEGIYRSEVLDAATIATWGTIRWQASTPDDSSVELFTRSGNTATPSDTWSPWSEAYRAPNGTPITSPKARYLQWRAVLRGERAIPALLSVTTAYLPRNLRPEVTNITVHKPGDVFQQAFSTGDPPIAGLPETIRNQGQPNEATDSNPQPLTLGRMVYRKGLQTFVWTAHDQNEDELQFNVLYRAEPDATWRALTRDRPDTIFAWDTTSAPDGTYMVRIEVSDELSNSPGLALHGWLDSTPFDIDNSPPSIELQPLAQDGDSATVTFSVTDAHSPIQHVEYSIDTERWQVIYPVDGIPDSRTERFEVTVAVDALDTLVIRATDAMNNTTTAASR